MGNRCVWLGGKLEDVNWSVWVCNLEHILDRHTQTQDWTIQNITTCTYKTKNNHERKMIMHRSVGMYPDIEDV